MVFLGPDFRSGVCQSEAGDLWEHAIRQSMTHRQKPYRTFSWFHAVVIIAALSAGALPLGRYGSGRAEAAISAPIGLAGHGSYGRIPPSRPEGGSTWTGEIPQDRGAVTRKASYLFRARAEKIAQNRETEARHFAARLKQLQRRQFAKRRLEFRRQQLRMESQKRSNRQKKARSKARQFAAARRHAASHAPKRRPRLSLKSQRNAHSAQPRISENPGTAGSPLEGEGHR